MRRLWFWQVSSRDSGSARVRISYLLGNLTKSFNYRAVATHDEKTLVLSEYMRIQNLANESFGSTGLWAGFGPRFLKPIGINETKEMLVEKFTRGAGQEDLHLRTRRPTATSTARRTSCWCRCTTCSKNNKANRLGVAPLQYGKVRIYPGTTATVARPLSARTGASLHRLDDEMRLYVRRGPGHGRQTHYRQEPTAPPRR